ncbi:MFS transporter [Candidatus Bathyarchaeota archaeon]|nr:MFS transporter [Candidatus Bathyarchaeota archaeon]
MGRRAGWSYSYTVLLITWLGWMSIYLARSVLPPVLPLLSMELGLSHAEAGLLETAYLIGYIVVKMPAGALSNRYGPRRVLTVSMLGYGASSMLISGANGFTEIFVLRLLVGLFQGVHLPVANSLLSDRFGDRQSKAIGFNESGANIGNALAFPLTVAIVSAWSWRAAFVALSLPAFALAGAALLLMRDEPKQSMCGYGGEGIRSYWRVLAPFALAHATYNLVLRTTFTFTPSFLVEYRGMAVAAAGLLATALPLAGVIAKISSGFASERLGRRRSICGATALSAVFLAALVALPDGGYLAVNLVALGLTLYLFSPIIYSGTTSSLPSGLKPLGLGAVTMFGNIVGAVSTSLVGSLIDSRGYAFTFTAVAVVSLVATVALLFALRE